MITVLLAVLSASAAAGMRIALPLTVIGLSTYQWWLDVPLLSYIHPQVWLSVLISWSLFEFFGSKQLLGQRVLQMIQLVLSPIVGGLMGITVVRLTNAEVEPIWLIGVIGGGFALVLKLVEIGWFFRLRGIPIWAVLTEDILGIFLVLLAFKAPEQGGIIAMLLLWLSIRSANQWRRWYTKTNASKC